MDLSIIIVNYNTISLLFNCIQSIYDKTESLNFEIIVVDNNSEVNPLNLLAIKYPQVRVINSSINLGFGKANNLGASYAYGKYLLFLNSDTILLNNAAYHFWNFLESSIDKKIVAVGGNLFTEDLNENFSYSTSFPSLINVILYRSRLFKFLNNDTFNRTKLPKQVSIIIGADLFITKSSFDEVAGFDPKIFMYIEDGDLQYQLFKLGYKVYNLPVAEIIHLQGASSTTGEKLLMEVKSYYYYFNKNYNNLISIIYLFIEISFAFICFIFFYLKGERIKSQIYYKLLKYIFNELLVKQNY